MRSSSQLHCKGSKPKAFSAGSAAPRPVSTSTARPVATRALLSPAAPTAPAAPTTPRRSVLLSTLAAAAAALLPAAAPGPAAANIVEDALRSYTRPDVSVQEAVVILLDARSTLREVQTIAATPLDSAERFRARAFWPAYAKRLRGVAEAAPVVGGLLTGAADKEETLSELYGGKGSGQGAVADALYATLGGVLTISGRTIRPEAQAGPGPAAAAEAAIEAFLAKVPAPILEGAQKFRVERAARAAAAGQQ